MPQIWQFWAWSRAPGLYFGHFGHESGQGSGHLFWQFWVKVPKFGGIFLIFFTLDNFYIVFSFADHYLVSRPARPTHSQLLRRAKRRRSEGILISLAAALSFSGFAGMVLGCSLDLLSSFFFFFNTSSAGPSRGLPLGMSPFLFIAPGELSEI